MAEEKNAAQNPWEALFLAVIFFIASVAMFLDTRPAFPERAELATSQGIVIAIEPQRGDDDFSLRLSDSERWYYAAYVENDERLEDLLRRVARGAVVTVLHKQATDTVPTDGSRLYVAAYGIAIGERDILTYEETRAAFEAQFDILPWLAGGIFLMAIVCALAACGGFLERQTARP